VLKLDGKAVAEARRARLREKVQAFQTRTSRAPGLAVILVGEDPASQVYVGSKLRACESVGIESFEHRLSDATTAHQLKIIIESLNNNPSVDGILLQLPLPRALSAHEAINWITPEKDADCLTERNLGRLWTGRPLTIPCTPWGVMAILEHYRIPVKGKQAVVVGRSDIVGKPMAHLLVQADATVTICHSKTQDLRSHTQRADLVVVAAGQPEFLGGDDFAKNAVVIDVGIHRKASASAPGVKSKLCGDVRSSELQVHAYTPVPGGVGPMTIAMLLENTLRLAEAREAL